MTPEEHEVRRTAIGASEVSSLLGINPHGSEWELWATKLGKLEPWDGNEATKVGNDYERALLDIAERELGTLTRQYRAKHATLPMAATLDGYTLDNRPVEAKTTGLVGPVFGRWGEAGSDEIPDYYLVQVHAQLMCTGADLAYLYALIAGRGTVRFEIEKSDSVAEMLGNEIANWWDWHIVRGIEPQQSEPPRLEVVKRLRKVPNKVVALPPEIGTVLAEFELCKERQKHLTKSKEDCESAILMALGDAECGVLPDGRRVEFMEVVRHMKAKEAYEQRFRQLRIK